MSMGISGIDELIAEINRIGGNLVDMSKTAISEAAEIIKQEMENTCPRSNSNDSHLADNIGISTAQIDSSGVFFYIGPKKINNNEFFYAKFLEFGTTKIRAHPFIETSFMTKKNEAMAKIEEVLRRSLNV